MSNTRDRIAAGLGLVKQQADAAMASTVSLAKAADPRPKLAQVNIGLTAGLGSVAQQANAAVASAVSVAKAADLRTKLAQAQANTGGLTAGLGFVAQQANTAMVSIASLAKAADLRPKLAQVDSTLGLTAGLGFVKRQATAVVSNRDGAAVGAAALVVGAVVGAYFLWPAAAAPAAGAAMKAPGAGGAFLISRAANPQLYFQILRTAGSAAAAAAFV